tara:strand:- start:7932 stop:9062 length:1131 start_codon:yes stop_codon:yes gene_type:complete
MKKREQHIIIFDIDSSSIGGGLFRYTFDANGVVSSVTELLVTRKNIGVLDPQHFDDYFNTTQKVLSQVARTLYRESRTGLDVLYLNVSAPWLSAQKRIIKKSEQQPFDITQDLLNELIEHDIEIAFDKSHTYQDHKVSLVDRKTIGVRGNGYDLRNPIGVQVKDLEIHSLASAMSDDTIEVFSHIIEKEFHIKPEIVSNPAISYQAVKNLLPHQNNLVVVDISGYSTECTVIESDHYKKHLVLPMGYEHMIDSIESETHAGRLESRVMFSPHYHVGRDDNSQADISSLQEKAFKTWYTEFHKALGTLSQEGKLPFTFLIRAPKAIKDGVQFHLLQQDSIGQYIKNHTTIEMVSFDFDNPTKDEELNIIAQVVQTTL